MRFAVLIVGVSRMTILWFQLVSMEAGGGGRDTNVSKT